VRAPVEFGSGAAALAGCGKQLESFNETLLAMSGSDLSEWHIERFDGPTGSPLSVVVSNGSLVTLAVDIDDPDRGQVRAITIHE
jgi:hypothetical protein